MIKKDEETEIYLHSKKEGFSIEVDLTNFENKQITMKTLFDSKPIKINIKEAYPSSEHAVSVEPNYEINLPDINPIRSAYFSSSNEEIKSDPEATPVPLSVPIDAMKITGECGCFTEFPCPNEEIDATGTCGQSCLSSHDHFTSFEYMFKGEQFAVYGTFDPNHGKFNLYLNDVLITEIDEYKNIRQAYSQLYLSDRLEYGEYKVRLQGKGNVFEIYKIVFWPSLKAKRLNSTEMTTIGNWQKESNKIGGLLEYTTIPGAKKSAIMECSKIWVYGTKDTHQNNMTLQFDEDRKTISEKSDSREALSLLYESDLVPHNYHGLFIESEGVIVIQCIYYLNDQPAQTMAPHPSKTFIPGSNTDYIDKTYTGALKDNISQINVDTGSNINEISGSKFIDIDKSNRIYFIKLQKEIQFHDNLFFNSIIADNRSAPIWATYNGQLSIIRCTFIKMKHNFLHDRSDGNVLSCSIYNLDVTFQSCKFYNCGDDKWENIIGHFNNEGGSIYMQDCTVTFDDEAKSCNVMRVSNQDIFINHSNFTRCLSIVKHFTLSGTSNFEFTNNIVSYEYTGILYFDNMQTKPIINGNVFQNCKIFEDQYYICYIHNVDEIEIYNCTFSNMSITEGLLYCGSVSFYIKRFDYKDSSLKFTNCSFIDNINSHTEFPFNQGGAIQCGYLSLLSNTSFSFTNCLFKGNKCLNGKGGALSISVTQKIEIYRCIFEDNYGSQGGGSIYILGTDKKSNNDQLDLPNDPSSENISILNSIFIGNRGETGSCILAEEDNVKIISINIQYCTFFDNGNVVDNTDTASLIRCTSAIFNFENNIITQKDLSQSSGGILINISNSANIEECTFINCSSKSDSIIQMTGIGSPNSQITNCRFDDCVGNKYTSMNMITQISH